MVRLLLYGVSAANLHKQQHVQNTLARVVTGTNKHDRISRPVLQALHWLQVNFRIMYKIAILMYKAIWTRQPWYLSEHIQPLARSCNFRSSGTDFLHISDSNLAPTNIARHALSLLWLSQSGTAYRSTLSHSR